MGLADSIHSLFVLGTTMSYALPAVEGVQRRSAFYVVLFLSLMSLSLILHCEQTGLCTRLPAQTDATLGNLFHSLSYFLLAHFVGIVVELKSFTACNIAAALFAAVLFATGSSGATVRNVLIATIIGAVALLLDIAQHRRRFTPAYWWRLGLIALLALLGAGLFAAVNAAWAWHGLWHIYIGAATYLLLLAQRHKRMLASRVAHRDGGGLGHSSGLASLTTPMKRRGTGGTSSGSGAGTGAGATAPQANGAGGSASSTSAGGEDEGSAPDMRTPALAV